MQVSHTVHMQTVCQHNNVPVSSSLTARVESAALAVNLLHYLQAPSPKDSGQKRFTL